MDLVFQRYNIMLKLILKLHVGQSFCYFFQAYNLINMKQGHEGGKPQIHTIN